MNLNKINKINKINRINKINNKSNQRIINQKKIFKMNKMMMIIKLKRINLNKSIMKVIIGNCVLMIKWLKNCLIIIID